MLKHSMLILQKVQKIMRGVRDVSAIVLQSRLRTARNIYGGSPSYKGCFEMWITSHPRHCCNDCSLASIAPNGFNYYLFQPCLFLWKSVFGQKDHKIPTQEGINPAI